MTEPPDRVEAAVSTITHFLLRRPEQNGPSPGDRAELRRMDPLVPGLPPPMWRLLTHPQVAPLANGDERVDKALAILAQAVLEAGAERGSAIGRALGNSRYSEERFVRLLRARTLKDLDHEVRQAARWCAARGVALRFTDQGRPNGLGRYILAAGLGWRDLDGRARAIARDYFSAAHEAGEPAATEA